MTIRHSSPFFTVLTLTVLGACGVSDLDVEGRDGADGSTGDGSASGGSAGDTGGTGSGGASAGSGGASAGSGGSTGGQTSGGSPGTGGVAGDGGTPADGGTPNPGTGGSSAGAGGTAGGTGGTGGGPTTPACRTGVFENVIFCDDFEDPALGEWTHFATSGSDGQTIRVADPVHDGMGALRSIKTAEGARDPLYADILGGRTSGRLYVRVWMHIPGTTTITPGGNASILVLGENTPSLGGLSIAMWSTAVTLQLFDPNDAAPYVQPAAFQSQLPRDAWFCLQLDFPIGTSVSTSEFRLRVNGTALSNTEPQRNVDSTLKDPYERLWVGVNYINPIQSTAVLVHYDDIAVDTVDVPCN